MHYKQQCRTTKVVITGISIKSVPGTKVYTLSKREMQVRGGNTKYKIKDKKMEILGQQIHPTYINKLQFPPRARAQNMPCIRSAKKLYNGAWKK
jgi:hypothetical protein